MPIWITDEIVTAMKDSEEAGKAVAAVVAKVNEARGTNKRIPLELLQEQREAIAVHRVAYDHWLALLADAEKKASEAD